MAILSKITSVILNHAQCLPVTYLKSYGEYSGLFWEKLSKSITLLLQAFAFRLSHFMGKKC